MLVSKDEEEVFDELDTLLYMYGRRSTKNVLSDEVTQEALASKSNSVYHGKVKKKKFSGNCNYYQRQWHWVRNCEK